MELSALLSTAGGPVDLTAALSLLAPHTRPFTAAPLAATFDQDWTPSLLHARPHASTSTAPSALSWLHSSLAPALLPSALALLTSSSTDEHAAQSLVDLVGFDHLELVGEAISRRSDMRAEAAAQASLEAQLQPLPPRQQHEPPPHNPRAGAGYAPSAQVTFQSAEDRMAAKRARRLGRHKGKGRDDGGFDDGEFDLDEMRIIREEELARGPGALVSGNRVRRARSEDLGIELRLRCAGKGRGNGKTPARVPQCGGAVARQPPLCGTEERDASRHDARRPRRESPLSLPATSASKL